MSDVQRSSMVQEPKEEGGQTLAAYALILSLIAILAIISLMFVGGQVNGIISTIGAALWERCGRAPARAGPAPVHTWSSCG